MWNSSSVTCVRKLIKCLYTTMAVQQYLCPKKINIDEEKQRRGRWGGGRGRREGEEEKQEGRKKGR